MSISSRVSQPSMCIPSHPFAIFLNALNSQQLWLLVSKLPKFSYLQGEPFALPLGKPNEEQEEGK